jgi:hypothetical protein
MTKSSTTKSTIKNDPFATVIPLPVETEAVEVIQAMPVEAIEPPATMPKVTAPEKPRVANGDRTRKAVASEKAEPEAGAALKTGKQKLTVHLEAALADRVKNAAYWNPRLTIAAIAEQGIRSAIEKFEREHGGKYPPREGELVGGRPIK